MARRTNNIEVSVVGEADFGRARKEASRALDAIEKDAKSAASDIERAFDRVELSPELDTADIRQALDLAKQLDGMVARLDIDADLEEIQQAEKIARSLRAFQGRVDLSVEGRAELQDALGLADKLDQIRTVKVQVQGQRDLQRAGELADELGNDLAQAGQQGAAGIADAIGGIDFKNIGAAGLDQLTGALTAAGPWGAAAAAIGVVFGDDLIAGIESGFARRRNDAIRAIRSGLSDTDLARAGEAGGSAYAAGFGDSLAQVKQDTDRLLATLGDDIPLGATFDDLAKRAQAMSDVLGVEVPQAAVLARRAVVQGLADDVADAFDDITGVVAEFGDIGLETLDIYEEFGGNFTRFGIDGGQAVRFVASAFEDGLFPTLDRAGELFEEFTTEITDGTAQRAIEELGVDFRQLQEDVAAGGERGRAALQRVVEALQTYGTEADRARLGNEIFKASFEQVTDDAELLDRILLLLGDTTDAYAGSAEDAARSIEDNASAFTILQREVEEAGAEFGDFIRWADEVAEIDLGAPFDIGAKVREWIGFTEDASDEAKRFKKSAEDAGRSTGEFGDEAGDAADEVDGLSGEVDELRDELDKLFNFKPDQLMRQIYDAASDLADAFEDVDASAVGLNGEIDISTEAGRKLQSRMEDMHDASADLEIAFADQRISAGELKAGQSLLRSEFYRVAWQMGLTTAKADGLWEKYLDLKSVGTINTVVTTEIRNANDFSDYLRMLNSTPKTITTRVNSIGTGRSFAPSRPRTTARATTRSLARAHGGPAEGLTWVGERGPELLDLPSGSFVHNNHDSQRMIASAASSSTGSRSGGGMTRQAPTVIEIRSGGSAFDDALVEVLRKAIQNRGGNVSAVLG